MQLVMQRGWKDLLSGLLYYSGFVSVLRKIGVELGASADIERVNPVFTIHRLGAENPYYEALPLPAFEVMVRVLATRYRVLPFSELTKRIEAGTQGPLDCAITFDDGYRETHRLAEPILRRHGVCATTFVVSGGLEGDTLWFDRLAFALQTSKKPEVGGPDGVQTLPLHNERERLNAICAWKRALRPRPHVERQRAVIALERELGICQFLPEHSRLLSTDDAKRIARSSDVWEVGSHTVNHVGLETEPEASCLRELTESRLALENIVQRPVTTIAYPHGGFSEAVLPLVKQAGYSTGATAFRGGNLPGTHPFQMQRTTAYWPTEARAAIGIEREFYRLPSSSI